MHKGTGDMRKKYSNVSPYHTHCVLINRSQEHGQLVPSVELTAERKGRETPGSQSGEHLLMHRDSGPFTGLLRTAESPLISDPDTCVRQ